MKKRLAKDFIASTITYLFSSFGVIILLLIFIFIFSNGAKKISINLLTGNYYSDSYTLKYLEEANSIFTYQEKEDEYFSKKWGVAFKDSINIDGENVVIISYIDSNSPLNNMINLKDDSYFSVSINQIINKGVLESSDSLITVVKKDSAKVVCNKFDNAIKINNLTVQTSGGGIRSSFITTLILIVITIIIALPIGICASIYLSMYAKKNRFTYILETMIDMVGGIPSIIFGLVGVIIFIPMMNKIILSDGFSIMAGSLTLSIMLLPTIIKTTKESIDNIPNDLTLASLALGASKTQTIFKIVLPNAISGILTSTILSISKIIGESAGLIFVLGTQVSDSVSLNKGGTTLATHIWNLLSGESPNYELACSIAIIILIIVLILNILVKIIGKKLNRFERI